MTAKMSLHKESYVTEFLQVNPHIKIVNCIWNIKHFCWIFEVLPVLSHKGNEYIHFYIKKSDNYFDLFAHWKHSENRPPVVCASVFFETVKGKELFVNKERLSFQEDALIICRIEKKYVCHNDNAKYLINGDLNIYIKLDILQNVSQTSINNETVLSCKKSAKKLINDKSTSIVTFVVEKKNLYANKAILCANSTVFKAMFNSGLEENINNKVEITDIKYNILKHLLTFIETGKLYTLHLDAETICEFFIAAEKYDIKDLKLKCEYYLIKQIKIGNIVKYLDFAHTYNAEKLKNYIKTFIKLCFDDIRDSDEYMILIGKYNNLLIEIINADELISEMMY